MSAVDGESRPAAENDAENQELGPDERAELERLRAEAAERGGQSPARKRRIGWRAPLATLLIVLGCVLAPVAVLGVWSVNEVSNTARYVATVEPLIHDPAIQSVLTDNITNQITSRLNLTGTINQAAAQLNSKGLTRIGSLLTTFGSQIASSATGFIHSTVASVIASPAMAAAWVQVNTIAHQAVVKVLSGQGNGALDIKNGQVVLNLGPLIAVAKQELVKRGFSLANSIPNINATVPLFEAKHLGQAQGGYRLVTNLKIVPPIVVLVLLGAGVWVARRHRRALIGAGLGLAASMLVLAVGLLIARSIYLGSVPNTVLPAAAAAAVYDAFVHFIKESLRVVLAVGLIVALGAFFTGPSRMAVATRSGLKSGMEWIRNFGERRGVSAGPVGRWTYQYRRILRIAAVAIVALIFVFWGQPTALVAIVLAIVLLVLLGLIELIGRPAAEPGTGGQTAEPGTAEPGTAKSETAGRT